MGFGFRVLILGHVLYLLLSAVLMCVEEVLGIKFCGFGVMSLAALAAVLRAYVWSVVNVIKFMR